MTTENKVDLTDVIVAGLRYEPKVAVEAIKQNITQNSTDQKGGFDTVFVNLMKKVANESITPKLALNVIDLYSQAASILGHPGAFNIADKAYRFLTFQIYNEKRAS